MKTIVETDRLLLREFVMDDAEVFFKMISGDIQMALGYKSFFIWVLISAIPVLILTRFVRIPEQEKEQPAAPAAAEQVTA